MCIRDSLYFFVYIYFILNSFVWNNKSAYWYENTLNANESLNAYEEMLARNSEAGASYSDSDPDAT